MTTVPAPARVLIGGGGVGALETALALRSLAGDRVELEMIARERFFSYRALSVGEPFGLAEAPRYELKAIARAVGIRLREDVVAGIDPAAHLVRTAAGAKATYDTLVLALGARPVASVPGAVSFAGPADAASLAEAIRAIAAGTAARVAFVVPAGGGWTLPLYELALLTAQWGHAHDARLELTVVTAETRPLEAFGEHASEEVAQILERRGIAVRARSSARRLEGGRLHLDDGGAVPADLAVAVPRLEGPAVPGLPAGPRGFASVDGFGRVRGVRDVYAVGDMADHEIKQGGLTAQQADVAAAHIAAGAGAGVRPQPYRPVLRGLLLTGEDPVFLRPAPDESDRAEALWWPAHKVVGHHLAAFLARHRHLAQRA